MRNIILFAVLGLLLCACAQAANREQVAQALRENPQLVFDALKRDKAQLMEILDQAVTEREDLERKNAQLGAMADPFKPEIESGRIFLGAAKAPVTIVEYTDFQCGYCAQGQATMKELLRRNPEKVRLIFKHFPAKPGSLEPAAAFEALARQNPEAAWRFADLAFANQRALADPSGRGLAAILASLEPGFKIDQKRLKKDMQSQEVRGRIEADVAEATRFGVDGTPTFLVNGIPIRGAAPIEDFEDLMALLTAKGGAAK
ncbi:MAG: thioredoxin domain-containing protein [Desulfovibrio sp.]|jgi:protein-disulfide isomerase|nr:thioredoxin domain-containing protein [Desulfovibrio sp.]